MYSSSFVCVFDCLLTLSAYLLAAVETRINGLWYNYQDKSEMRQWTLVHNLGSAGLRFRSRIFIRILGGWDGCCGCCSVVSLQRYGKTNCGILTRFYGYFANETRYNRLEGHRTLSVCRMLWAALARLFYASQTRRGTGLRSRGATTISHGICHGCFVLVNIFHQITIEYITA